jgi:hypothetical protein
MIMDNFSYDQPESVLESSKNGTGKSTFELIDRITSLMVEKWD